MNNKLGMELTRTEKNTIAFGMKNSIFDMLECILLVKRERIEELSIEDTTTIAKSITCVLKDSDVNGHMVAEIIAAGYELDNGVQLLLYPSNYEVTEILERHLYF